MEILDAGLVGCSMLIESLRSRWTDARMTVSLHQWHVAFSVGILHTRVHRLQGPFFLRRCGCRAARGFVALGLELCETEGQIFWLSHTSPGT